MVFECRRRSMAHNHGKRLPSSASDLHYFRHDSYPDSDLNLITVYIKFRTSRQAYLDLIQQLDAEFHQNLTNSWHYTWPDEWSGLNDLDWWDMTTETTEDVALTPPGKIRLRAKYERGAAYIKCLR